MKAKYKGESKETLLNENINWLKIPNAKLRVTCNKKELVDFKEYFEKELTDEQYNKIEWKTE